jgi:hypothetical protein
LKTNTNSHGLGYDTNDLLEEWEFSTDEIDVNLKMNKFKKWTDEENDFFVFIIDEYSYAINKKEPFEVKKITREIRTSYL